MQNFVLFDHVCKTYRMGDVCIDALKDASFTIAEGEICVIVGQSGAGKTTLLNILGGMDRLTSGHVLLAGEDVAGYNRKLLTTYRRHAVGFVFQFYNLLPNMTALENVQIAGQLCKNPVPAEEVLRQVGLGERMQNFPAQLSGGEQQRVAIARALATNPKVLLCDEATSALDPNTTRSILELLREINKTLGVTIIVITHEMKVIDQICDRVAVIDKSCIAEEGRVADVFTNPKSDIARELVLPQERPVLDPTTGGRKLRLIFNGEDTQKPGELTDSSAEVRSLFCVYGEDDQEGALRLLTTVEHFRQELLMHGVIGKQFALDLSQKLSTLYYTDNTAPYFCAEVVSVWKIPSVNREAFSW